MVSFHHNIYISTVFLYWVNALCCVLLFVRLVFAVQILSFYALNEHERLKLERNKEGYIVQWEGTVINNFGGGTEMVSVL